MKQHNIDALIRRLDNMIDGYEVRKTGKSFYTVRKERLRKESLNNTK